ncbi:I78 family peptidase inhibitor [Ramlibacter sp. PS4R-6]|uniref:I78 family peptidase inhibitor n=1 Tax=Ramlibacter sp. PS4R-6 TaxID=3133438 RepID=UPI0030A1E093
MKFACLAPAALALVAGCTVPPPDVPEAPPPPVFAPGECDAQAAQFAVGQPYNNPLGEQARSRARAERVRPLHPGQVVTMEFDARRLSIDVDASGKVVAVRCG